MFYYKYQSPQIHALHLEVPVEVFLQEWKNSIGKPDYDISYFLEILQPFVRHWIRLLTEPGFYDLQSIALFNQLEIDGDPREILERWLETLVSLEAELNYLLIYMIRKLRYFPSLAKPIKAEYIFASRFRLLLRTQLRNFQTLNLENYTESLEHQDILPDILLLKHLSLDAWGHYLFFLLCQGYTINELESIVKIPRETYYYEGVNIWQQLKNLWQAE